jgi:site-specific DNA-methyltransferase (adenine-specific)
MSIHEALYSSRTDEWPTPQSFFDDLNAEFDFTLDPCASPENAKCPTYFTKDDDGLKQEWGSHRVFCNPPYGKTMREWASKCYEASRAGALVVLLAHSRTDTRWFHDSVYGKAEIRFVRGRLKFGDGIQSAPFPSMVAIFRRPRSARIGAGSR